MGKATVTFQFSIKDRVLIKAIEVRGQVDALSQDERENQYRVVYWNDGQRYSVWMYGWELEETK